MTILIAYFSGTGSTRYVAETFEKEFRCRNLSVEVRDTSGNTAPPPHDLLVICFAVHACNAPVPVLKWVENLPEADRIPAAVFSVSGGGEITPNLACRLGLKKRLKKKNYHVIYEDMIVMPSNWIVGTKPVLIDRLLEVLPVKVSHFADELLAGKSRQTRSGLGNRILSLLGKLEPAGARRFGKKIRVNDRCTGCGQCARECPVGNISMKESLPVFSGSCILCLKCLYGCQFQALEPGMAKFIVISEGYDFNKMVAAKGEPADIDLVKETRGFLWLGLRRYLS
jgi:ferredoxin